MEYKKEIIKFLSSVLREDWMNEEEWNELLSSIDIEQLNKDLEVGLSNGYSIEEQFNILKMYKGAF